MALFSGSVFSHALGLDTQIGVIFPDIPYDIESRWKKPALLTLLHGLTDNATGWARLTQAEYFAKVYNFVIVMPEVQRSQYCDMVYGGKYFTYVSEELPELAGAIFNLPTGKENTFIAGLSMGGYGSLKVALSSPERYGGVASFSGGVDTKNLVRMMLDPENERAAPGDIMAIFGTQDVDQIENTVFALARQVAARPDRPRLLQTCGTEDFLYDDNRRLKETLQQAGYGHTYLEWSGGHEWPFWNRSLELAMQFFRGEDVAAPAK